jgi:hypothetical protein
MSEQFYNWLGQRIEDYEAARERGIKAFETRVARNAAALNGGIEPNVSSAGFHAPIEGYRWESGAGEHVYLKGQFLPDYGLGKANIKIGDFDSEKVIKNVPLERAQEFIDKFDDVYVGRVLRHKWNSISVTKGACYESDTGLLCYVYISKCPKDLIAAIEDYLIGDVYKLQRLAQEKTEQERADRDAAHANGEDAPEGRQVITGTLLTLKYQESHYGETLKMLVQDDRGFRVWGSVPSSLDANRNDRIQFTAAITQSDKDSKFGFFKRPTKAQII